MVDQHNNEFVFYSDKLSYKTTTVGKEKEYFIEGHISTGDIDLVNDIVTKSCMDSMITQFDKRSIKLDFEHETFRGKSKLEAEANKTRLPLGKAISKHRDEKGVVVKWKMNPTWKKFDAKGNIVMTFKEIWANVKSEMLDAFSIAYVPTRTKSMELQGKSVRMLDAVNLLNVALTGNPINPAATMSAVMAKSLEFMKGKEEDKMDDMENVEIKDFDKLDEALKEIKSKYIKRTGGPGNYKYTYAEDGKHGNQKPSGDKKEYTTKQAVVMSMDPDVSAQEMSEKFSPDQLRQASESPMSENKKITQARLLQEKKPKKESSKTETGKQVEKQLSKVDGTKYNDTVKLTINGEQQTVKSPEQAGKLVDKAVDAGYGDTVELSINGESEKLPSQEPKKGEFKETGSKEIVQKFGKDKYKKALDNAMAKSQAHADDSDYHNNFVVQPSGISGDGKTFELEILDITDKNNEIHMEAIQYDADGDEQSPAGGKLSDVKKEKKSAEDLFKRAVELDLTVGMADRFIKSKLLDSDVDKENMGYKQMVKTKDEEVPEAEAQPPETPVEQGKEPEAEGAKPEGKSMTLTELKSVVETLETDVTALKQENADLKAIVNKPLQKSKGPESKEEKSQKEAEVKSFGGPMDLIA